MEARFSSNVDRDKDKLIQITELLDSIIHSQDSRLLHCQQL